MLVLARLGRFTVAHRKAVLVGTALFFVLAVTLGGGVASRLTSGGFTDPDSESSRAADAVKHDFGKQEPDLVLLVTAKRGTVDDAEVGSAANALTSELSAEPQVSRAVSYWSVGSPPPLRSTDGRQALVLASLRGGEDKMHDAAAKLSPRYAGDHGAEPLGQSAHAGDELALGAPDGELIHELQDRNRFVQAIPLRR